MKYSQRLLEERRYIEGSLADSVICQKCKCTLDTYAALCSADLSDQCPGFLMIENAKRAFGQGARLRDAAGKQTSSS